MEPLFSTVQLLDARSAPGEAAWNMAADEALLATVTTPVLRIYRWVRPAFSFGYFLPVADAQAAAGEREIVRRWTGGGMVPHGDDFTWSLIVPAGEPAARMRPAASYAAIHSALAQALLGAGIRIEQVPADAAAPAGGLCFTAPAPGDLLIGGRKIAGAGQRRTRLGLLHQGSVCGPPLPDDFPQRLADSLARNAVSFPESQFPGAATEALVAARYGTREWLHLR